MSQETKNLRIEKRETRALIPNPANLKNHPEEQIRRLKASLKAFGQKTPLVIDSGSIIRKGNGTHEAMLALLEEGDERFKTAWVIITDLKGSDLAAWEIADNRTAELGEWDEPALAKMLEELRKDEIDLDTVGFSEVEMEALLEEVALMASDDPVDPTAPPQGGHPFKKSGGPEAPPGAENPPETPAPPPDAPPAEAPPAAPELDKLTLKLTASKKTQLLEDLALVRDKEKLETDADAICYLAELYCRGGE